MSKIKLTAILVTRNEAKNIRRCLGSLRWVDEIVIVDQSSVDDTVAICKEFTDKVYVVSNKGYCEPDRPVALSHSTSDWNLYLDADEQVSESLREELTRTLENNPERGSYYLPRKNIFLGKWIRGSGWYPGHVLRLFRKDAVCFSERIHTDVEPLGPPGYLKEPLLHYTCEDLEDYLRKLNRYTGILAQQAYEQGKRITALNCVLKIGVIPSVFAFKKFILMKGFRDGRYGVLIAFLTALTVFLMNAKLWELQEQAKVRGLR
jgi:glycosyltransferase involved in cell wall biosynthesis